ncbi:DUF5134 domain-containing protein [Frankia sp. Ag45/Mut15]|uniref:DUF5134 domain-containing protein n=1 Tax=Frankia umida TaxID=573489 RepID=A0ABT0K1Q7_9ACTN|nr:DUF5134 domain-containing protein [Frankia umida]MCK9877464.1 DUF5134 domain-containing protein [Frankia umida]
MVGPRVHTPVNHDHLTRSATGLPTSVAVLAAVLAGIVGLYHAARLLGPVAGRVVGGRPRFVPAETGHTIVAAGMVVMFVGPAGWWRSPAFALGFAGIALVFLTLVVTGPACCEPARWSCCSMLVVESLAMACMARAGQWPMAEFGMAGDLSGWFIVVFAVSAASALVGSLPRRAWAWMRARPLSAGPVLPAAVPITPAASRLVMAAAMLVMLV